MAKDIYLFNKHPAFIALPNVAEICRPLEEKLSAKMFCYHRIFSDGSEIMLSSNDRWASHFYTSEYLMGGKQIELLGQHEFKHTIWPIESSLLIINEVRDICQIHHGITLRINSKNYYELFGFGIAPNITTTGVNLLLNNIGFLEKFCLNFKKLASKIIDSCNSNKIIIPEVDNSFYTKIILSAEDNSFLKYPTPLSKRQKQCLFYILRGKSATAIADILHLSPRTVETHIEEIKNKFGCCSKAELIETAFQNGYLSLLSEELAV